MSHALVYKPILIIITTIIVIITMVLFMIKFPFCIINFMEVQTCTNVLIKKY